jgi:hypothetical protein
MKRAVHSLAKEALTAYPKGPRTSWILQWPSQLVLNCSQVGPSHYCLISKLPNTAQHQDKRTLCCGATGPQPVERCFKTRQQQSRWHVLPQGRVVVHMCLFAAIIV